jgi:hypothetical protein
VIAAANAILVNNAVGERCAAMWAGLSDDPVTPALGGLEQRPILTEKSNRLGESVIEVLLEGDRVPIPTQKFPHRSSRTNPGQFLILFDSQHDLIPSFDLMLTVIAVVVRGK